MSRFGDELTITWLPDGQNWRVFSPLVYTDDLGTIIVPTGFVSDGASVPRPLWWFLPAFGTYSRAAIVHDYLCSELDAGHLVAGVEDRKTADLVFFEAMVDEGVGMTMRWLMWATVRLYAIIARK